MGLSFFIAKRLSSKGQYSKQTSLFIILNIVAITLSTIVLIATDSITNGFDKTIHEKITGLWGHIHIQTYQPNASGIIEEKEFLRNEKLEKKIRHMDNIEYAIAYATKYGLLFSDEQFEGILFKGIEKEYQKYFSKRFLSKGSGITFNENTPSNDIIISDVIAKKLNLNIGDYTICNFVYDKLKQRKRKLKVVGIYKSGIEEFDNQFCIIDLKLIQKLNQWGREKIGGYEVFIYNIEKLEHTETSIFDILPELTTTKTIKELFPELFDWLRLININKFIIFAVILLVSLINIITSLFILIIDRMKMIALLYSLGIQRWQIQKIFIMLTVLLSSIGLVAGNVIGILLLWLLKKYEWITLNSTAYITDSIPIDFNVWHILGINLGLVVIIFLTLIVPSFFVKRKEIVRLLQLE